MEWQHQWLPLLSYLFSFHRLVLPSPPWAFHLQLQTELMIFLLSLPISYFLSPLAAVLSAANESVHSPEISDNAIEMEISERSHRKNMVTGPTIRKKIACERVVFRLMMLSLYSVLQFRAQKREIRRSITENNILHHCIFAMYTSNGAILAPTSSPYWTYSDSKRGIKPSRDTSGKSLPPNTSFAFCRSASSTSLVRQQKPKGLINTTAS